MIALHSQLGNDIEAIGKQLEEIDSIIQEEDNTLSHWISSNDWSLTRDWVSRMIGRILGPHRSQTTWSYDSPDIEESFETRYSPSKQKRYFINYFHILIYYDCLMIIMIIMTLILIIIFIGLVVILGQDRFELVLHLLNYD